MVEKVSFHRRIFNATFDEVSFMNPTGSGSNFIEKKKTKTKQKDKKRTRKQQEKCVYVQNIAECEDGDDIPVQNSICPTEIQK